MKIGSKEIKKYILGYNDLEELFNFLEIEFKETIEAIFNALFILLKNYEKNKMQVEYLIYILTEQLETKSLDELKLLTGPIIDFQNKISALKVKERIKIKSPCFRIQNIFNEIQVRLANNLNSQKKECLEFLIFYDKNISMIEKFLKENDSILNLNNKDEENIFLKILRKYLTTSDEEDYLYHVILIIFKSKHGEQILKQKEKYIELINSSTTTSMKKIAKLMQLFDEEYCLASEELENKYNIHFNFPDAILHEVNTFKIKNKKRIDYTKQNCITIDGELATCLDDAIYIEKNKDGTYNLYIHIIDIPSFIPYNSMTREEASIRGETIYLRDRNILLYPSPVSNEVCSLLPNNYRNTITYIFRLDPKFNIIPNSFNITLGKIKVAHRLTYESVDNRIKKPLNSSLDKMLIYLLNFATIRKIANKEKEIYREYENLINQQPNHESTKINVSNAANIVHESMILTNYQVAKTFKELSLPYIYRKLNIPSQEQLEKKIMELKKLGTKIEKDKGFLSSLKDSYITPIYCQEPTYHVGLNIDCYSHSTSPSRRYMDSLGQYIIHDLLIDKNTTDKNIDKWEYTIDKSVQYINERKKQNETFEREYNYLSYKKLIKNRPY